MMRLLKRVTEKAKTLFGKMKSKFDKGGSYTGNADDHTASPEQDADDL